MAKITRALDLEQVLARTRFQDLMIFEAVARLGSIAAVARERRLNPPLISKSIKKLERAAGRVLFDRSNQGFRLTPDGQEFLEFQARLSDLLASAQLGISRGSAGALGELALHTVAGQSFLITHFLPEALYRLSGYGSKYRFRVLTLGQAELVDRGMKGHFDIALHTQPLPWPRAWTVVPMGQLPWILCARAGHALGRKTTEQRLRTQRFVVPAHGSEKGFRRGDDRCPMPLKSRLIGDEAGTAETGLALVARSEQLVFVPEIVAREWIARGTIQEVEVPDWTTVRDTVYLAVHAEKVSQRIFKELTRFGSGVLAG